MGGGGEKRWRMSKGKRRREKVRRERKMRYTQEDSSDNLRNQNSRIASPDLAKHMQTTQII